MSLLEATLFVAIALSITLGGLSYYRQTNEATDVAQTVRSLSTLIAGVRAGFAAQPDYSTLSPRVVINGGMVPKMMTNADGTGLVTPWGPIDIGPAPGNPNRFVLVLRDLPVTACTRLGPFGTGGAGMIADGVVNFEVWTAAGEFDTADEAMRNGWPTDGVSPSEAAEACRAAGTVTTWARWTFSE